MKSQQDRDGSAQASSPPPAGGAGGAVQGVPLHRGTLPPPDWSAPRSVSGLAIEWLAQHAPVARRRGVRAELASLRAKQRAAAQAGDSDAERVATAALARALAAQGTELDFATKLARRALMLGDDPPLREELSSWFAALGEPGLAAATLRPLVETESGERLGRLLTRIAVFLGRHGDARGAAEALASASRESAQDPVPEELRGAIGAWASDAVSGPEAASAYLEAARRREALGDRAAAFEDLLRAFEMAPDVANVAERLSSNLAARARTGAADEVLREHARASGERGVATHRARLRDAVVDGDGLRALGAAFDAGLDRGFDAHVIASAAVVDEGSSDAVTFDRLLADVGLHEIVAARLELAAEGLSGPERARARIAQGAVCAGPIGSAERTVDAWVDALVSDPSSETAKALLRQHAASSGDHGPLVEALVRVGMDAVQDRPHERTACLRELVVLADQRLADPSLALWAVRRLLGDEQRDEELRSIGSRLAQRARLQEESLASTRVQLAAAKGPARLDLLRLAAVALRGRPDDAVEQVAVLEELADLVPDERAWRQSLERVLERLGKSDALERLYRHDLERKVPKVWQERARLALAALARARGDAAAALRELEPLLGDAAANRAGWGMLFALASREGKEGLRAETLCRIATLAEPALHALLASVAADIHLSGGDEMGARRAAEQACHADSSAPRSIAVLARATLGLRDRIAAVALERAAGVVLPRAYLCRALAETFDALGEPASALAWTQRWLALRPGDRAAAAALLARVTVAGEPSRIADALGWLLAQPEPLTELVPWVCKAVCRLAEVDPPRGATVARRALDVFGPRIPELRDAVLAAADSVGERGLAIAVLERQLASGSTGGDRAEMLLDLARRRRHSGDADGAARSLVRALAEGADAASVLAELDVALPPRSSDGEIAILEGRAEALSALSSADLAGTARAWRELGAALWDLAGDREGTIAAWERSAALDGENGLERLARDLVSFAGHADAVRLLEDLATRRRGRADVARALAAAAGVALEGGLTADALAIAIRALEADSSRADVLGIAERAASEKDVDQLERAYDIVARGAMGNYGERAAHYRAARQLERRGFRERALRHAIVAFAAVPAEGVAFVLMMRLAERTGDATEAVHAIERVASRSKGAEERAAWLRRAAVVAGSSDEGKRQRVEVLLRALDANPHAETLRSLGAAFVDLVRTFPDEKDIAELRFARALRAMLPRLEGPEGARVAVEAAQNAITTFGVAELAIGALERAAESDASIDEYTSVVRSARVLAAHVERARGLVDRIAELTRSPYANVGPALVALGEAIAVALGEPLPLARLLVAAALKEPENVELLRRAETAARASSDAGLVQAVLAAVPLEERLRSLMERAATAQGSGDAAAAVLALEEARGLERAPEEARREIMTKLRALYRELSRWDALERLLREAVDGAEQVDERVLRTRELASLLADQDREDEAFALLEKLLVTLPGNRDLLGDLLNHARRTNDSRRQIEALSRLGDLEEEPAKRLVYLRRLAPLLAEEGDTAGELARFQQILALDPRDAAALAAMERNAERRGDWEALTGLLSRRAALAQNADEARQVRLRRAELLEAKLGRPHDARGELEALLTETGDHLLVLTRLADLNERLGAKLRAAPLWLRASTAPKDRAEAGELARRACQAYLDGGDVESARRVFSEMAEYPRTPRLIALRVDIERRSENPRALSEALEEMALSSMDPPKVRAALLVEAARAALAAGQLAMALGQAQRSARIARESSEPQLFARLLEYRHRAAGTREEAATTVTELRSIREALEPAQRELQAFLLAEALDVATGEGEGMRELSRVHAELGALPLVAVGMAERLARGAEAERALPLFDAALEGDLRELRRRGEVALAAALAAERASQPDRALEYLEMAAAMPETRALALGKQTELRTSLGRISDAPPLVEADHVSTRRGGHGSSPDATAAFAASLSETQLVVPEAPPPVEPEEPVLELRSRRPQELAAEPVLELRRPPSDRAIDLTVRRSPESLRSPSSAGPGPIRSATPPTFIEVPAGLRASAPPKPRRPSAVPVPVSVTAQPPVASRVPTPPIVSHAPAPLASRAPPKPAAREALEKERAALASTALVHEAPPPPGPTGERPSRRPPPGGRPVVSHAVNEEALFQALARGSIDAGKELVLQLENRSDRTQELVGVCRRVAFLLPGDRAMLEKLYEATLADRNIVYARAVEHVLRAFDPKAAPLEPPPLAEQIEQPDRVHAVLFRDTASAATEALALVWNGAQHMFRRDPSSYGVTGLERVAPNAPTPLAKVFSAASRLLGMSRTPLFQRKSGQSVTINVALLAPPALLLTGEVKSESPSLAYHIGAMLAATLPEHVLLYGSPEAQVENVLRALVASFGPPQEGRGHLAAIATLAEMLWESMPARSQRRLRELCDEPSRIDYNVAQSAARQAVRRTGLFVSGDLTIAVRETCSDLGVSTWGLDAPGGLAALCSSSPAVADLVRLATSPEYASTRWQQVRTRHPSGTWSTV